MKKLLILLLTATISLSSCKDFLTVVPADARFLNDMSDVSRTMASYLLQFQYNMSLGGTEAPSSWVSNQYGSPTLVSHGNIWAFTYSDPGVPEKRILDRAVENAGNWAGHYAIIAHTTLVNTMALKATGSDEMRNYVRGEALVHRAFSFFKLLQYYAPMDDQTLGVPVMLDIYADFREADLQRKPQSEVYARILEDLLEAERLLGITAPRKTYNIAYNYDYVYRILSMVYLWRACTNFAEETDWANAAKYADLAINSVNAADGALPFTLDELFRYCHTYNINYLTAPSAFYPEGLHYFHQQKTVVLPPSRQYSLEVWRTLYDETDLRQKTWFHSLPLPPDQITQSDLTPHEHKFNPVGAGTLQNMAFVTFRLSEQYLIWIEALAHTDFGKAKEVLLTWQSVRYDDAMRSQWFVPASAEELVEWIYLERKREFVLEGDIIWLDMKRFRIEDTRGAGGFDFTLHSDDFRYQFKIPDSETEKNTTIIRNPGWDNLSYN